MFYVFLCQVESRDRDVEALVDAQMKRTAKNVGSLRVEPGAMLLAACWQHLFPLLSAVISSPASL
jgi:hypothetical protein